jgi:hypothetical protein
VLEGDWRHQSGDGVTTNGLKKREFSLQLLTISAKAAVNCFKSNGLPCILGMILAEGSAPALPVGDRDIADNKVAMSILETLYK